MNEFPADHADRLSLADEVHARPHEQLRGPARASYLALQLGEEQRDAEQAQLAALCRRLGLAAPPAGATHWRAEAGALRLKWERHGEFSGWLLWAEGVAEAPFADAAHALLPAGWLAGLPGRTIAAVRVELRPDPGDDAARDALLQQAFGAPPTVGSAIADGAARLHTDLRLAADGCTRLLVLDRGLSPGQAGRTLQRLTEIEAYRMLALLALPIARRQAPRLREIEAALARLADQTAGAEAQAAAGGPGSMAADERLLHELTRLAAEVESGLAASQFRYGACRAYHDLVGRRVAELREQRLGGTQTLEEFLNRRFAPAVATCATAAARLAELSQRVQRAGALLSTRVDIARERQNQALLRSMDRRAQLQLRLQQTVEGLSVAAIVYYLAGLVGYGAKAAKSAGLAVNADLAVGLSLPLLAAAAFAVVRRARRHARDPALQEPAGLASSAAARPHRPLA